MDVFVISIFGSSRRGYVRDLLNLFDGFRCRVITACTSRSIVRRTTFDKLIQIATYGRYLSDGEVGCATSHQRCYEAILEEDLQYALILEDDVQIECSSVVELSTLAPRLLEVIPDADIISFYSADFFSEYSQALTGTSISFAKTKFYSDNTLAYIVTNKGARSLLSRSPFRLSRYLADWPIPIGEFNHYVVSGFAIGHLSEDIGSVSLGSPHISLLQSFRDQSRPINIVLHLILAVVFLPINLSGFKIFLHGRVMRSIIRRIRF